MMLRTLAILGLSTVTVTATMASVKDGDARPIWSNPTAAAVTLIDDPRVPALESGEISFPTARKATRPAARLVKQATADLKLPVGTNSKLLATGRILVKFENEIGARCDLHPSTNLFSLAGEDLSPVLELLEEHDATVQQFIHKTPAELERLREKAESRSGRVQPDFASMMIIDFPQPISPNALLTLGRRLNDLEVVEYLSFEIPVSPAGGAPTTTPDWVSGPWGSNPVAPAVFPTFATNALQQYQLVAGPFNPVNDPPVLFVSDVAPDDPSTWFGATAWQATTGYGLPWMTRLAGQAWRRYGSPPSDNAAFDVGTGASAGFFGTLPSPTKVWLYGAEFEIVDLTECEAGLTDYDCAECFIVNATDGATKDATNPFPEFATDPLNPQIYTNIKLCPTGRITEIGIVDFAVFAQHEEFLFDRAGNLLEPADRRLLVEPDQTMVYLSLDEDWRPEASHGTATSGVLVAGNNDFGLTGMTWASRVRFYPSISIEEGARLSTAIANAIADLDAGSILCIPIQTGQDEAEPEDTTAESGVWSNIDPFPFVLPPPPDDPGIAVTEGGGGGQFVSSNGLYALLIAAATDAGIVVVQAGGNGSEPLANEAVDGGTGSIVVTAATPSPIQTVELVLDPAATVWGGITTVNDDGDPIVIPYPAGQSKWSGSNFFSPGGESNVLGRTVSGWGMGVPSLGYGDLYKNLTPPLGLDPAELDPLEREFLRSYTGPRAIGATFGGPDPEVLQGYEFGDANCLGLGSIFQGTSCAAPQIAGLAAWLQGFGEMFYGTTLSGSQILTAMNAVDAEGQLVNFGESVGEPTIGFDSNGSGLNNVANDNFFNIASEPALIPPVPEGPRSAFNVIRNLGQGWSGSLKVYWGTRVQGTGFSVGNRNDGNALEIRSRFAAQGPGAGNLTYPVSGQTTDFGMKIKSQIPGDEILSMSVTAFRRTTTTVVIEIAFARNFVTNRYVPLGAEVMPTVYEEAAFPFQGVSGTFTDFVNAQDDIDLRFYTVGLGFITGSSYVVRYDEVKLNQNEDNAPL